MRCIFGGISVFLILVLVRGFYAVLNNPKSPEKGKVILPKIICILGIVVSVMFIIPAIITLFSDYDLWVVFIFLIFSLFGAALINFFCNCRITYDEKHFIYRNFFAIQRSYTYDDVVSIKENMHEKVIYIGKYKIRVYEYSIGGKEFVLYVKKKYRKLHNGLSIPKVHKTKHNIFNNNVYDTGGFVLVYILIFVVLLVALVAFIDYAFFSPYTPDNTICQNLCFDMCNEIENELVLKSTNNSIYKIYFTEDEFDPDVIYDVCDGKTCVTVYSYMITPGDEDDYYSVKAVSFSDKYLLSFEQTNNWHKQESWVVIIYISAMLILWCVYVVLSIIVGRNPQKYNRKVIKIFFKDGYVKYYRN